MVNGAAFGKVIEIGTERLDYKLAIKDLKPVKTVTLPRPYPSFLPYFLEHNLNTTFDINKVESIQFSIGHEITKSEFEEKCNNTINLRIKTINRQYTEMENYLKLKYREELNECKRNCKNRISTDEKCNEYNFEIYKILLF